MCGRFTLTKPPDLVTQHFSVPAAAASPRYNIAPTQTVWAVRASQDGVRELIQPVWGLIPAWTRELSDAVYLINARAETLSEKPAFRNAFRERRCLIPADGFYEWQQTVGKLKQPWYIQLQDSGLFGFGGLWEEWRSPSGEIVNSCAIVTVAANEAMAPVHDRMPLILAPEAYDAWLAPREAGPSEILQPYPSELLRLHPVSTEVNRPGNDHPGCREPRPSAPGALFSP